MASVTIDPTLHLTPSTELVTYLRSQDLESPPDNVQKLLEPDDDGVQLLTVEDIKWLASSCPRLPSSLLFSCGLQLPISVFPARDPKLEARCQKLRAEQEDREYQVMTSNVRRDGPSNTDQEPFKKQFKELNSFLVLILQFVVSVAASFMFGFLGPYYLYGRTDLGPRLLAGIICAFVVGCADMYFVIRQMLEEDGYTLNKKLD